MKLTEARGVNLVKLRRPLKLVPGAPSGTPAMMAVTKHAIEPGTWTSL